MSALTKAAMVEMLTDKFDWIGDEFQLGFVRKGVVPTKDQSNISELPVGSVLACGPITDRKEIGKRCCSTKPTIVIHPPHVHEAVDCFIIYRARDGLLVGWIDTGRDGWNNCSIFPFHINSTDKTIVDWSLQNRDGLVVTDISKD